MLRPSGDISLPATALLAKYNHIQLDRPFLTTVLNNLSERLLRSFGFPVRLVVHGGAVMVLHPSLRSRKHTRDIDYLHRAFVADMALRGLHDAGPRLMACIDATAHAFRLGHDWMNAHADVALPMSIDPTTGAYIDPIHLDALQPTNTLLNTIYRAPGLELVAVTWPWAVALKLVRYQKDDPADIAAILALGQQVKGVGFHWTRDVLEKWLLGACRPMGYERYPEQEIEKTRAKMRDAVWRMRWLVWYGGGPAATAAVQVQGAGAGAGVGVGPGPGPGQGPGSAAQVQMQMQMPAPVIPHLMPPAASTSSWAPAAATVANPNPEPAGRDAHSRASRAASRADSRRVRSASRPRSQQQQQQPLEQPARFPTAVSSYLGQPVARDAAASMSVPMPSSSHMHVAFPEPRPHPLPPPPRQHPHSQHPHSQHSHHQHSHSHPRTRSRSITSGQAQGPTITITSADVSSSAAATAAAAAAGFILPAHWTAFPGALSSSSRPSSASSLSSVSSSVGSMASVGSVGSGSMGSIGSVEAGSVGSAGSMGSVLSTETLRSLPRGFVPHRVQQQQQQQQWCTGAGPVVFA